jgi:hypothetical protein
MGTYHLIAIHSDCISWINDSPNDFRNAIVRAVATSGKENAGLGDFGTIYVNSSSGSLRDVITQAYKETLAVYSQTKNGLLTGVKPNEPHTGG